MNSKLPARRNPLLKQEPTLSFDDLGEEALLELTPEQQQDRFLSRWMELVDPYDTYPRVFRRGEKAGDRVLREIKLYYRTLVVEGDWTERKYVMVVNSMLEGRVPINSFSLDKWGHRYEEELLPVQIRLKRGRS